MDAKTTWRKIINSLHGSSAEFQLKRGKWFKASAEGNIIYIEPAEKNTPSSNITLIRGIKENEFISVFEYYNRWIKEESGITAKAGKVSMNTSYIFTLINNFT